MKVKKTSIKLVKTQTKPNNTLNPSVKDIKDASIKKTNNINITNPLKS